MDLKWILDSIKGSLWIEDDDQGEHIVKLKRFRLAVYKTINEFINEIVEIITENTDKPHTSLCNYLLNISDERGFSQMIMKGTKHLRDYFNEYEEAFREMDLIGMTRYVLMKFFQGIDHDEIKPYVQSRRYEHDMARAYLRLKKFINTDNIELNLYLDKKINKLLHKE